MIKDGLIANGTDGVLGSFDADRVNNLIDIGRPVYAAVGQEPPADLTADDVVTNEFLDPSISLSDASATVDSVTPATSCTSQVDPVTLLLDIEKESDQTARTRFARMSSTDPAPTPVDVKPRSHDVTDFPRRARARAMLRAVGFTDDDWDKPQIGVANSWNEITPCNLTLRALAEHVKRGVRDSGGMPLEFGTITVSDGISMGHEGMRASLVSREIITDSVEAVVFAERLDGFVGMAGCDKSMPAMLMAAARIDLPSVLVYNGSIMPGHLDGRALDITSVFEGLGAYATGSITADDLAAIERHACPGEGACGGMFTANTMSSIGEALGMSVPGSASPPAIDARRNGDAGRRRRRRGEHAAARHHAAPDHDQAGVRERDRPHLGARPARPMPCSTCLPSPTRPAWRSTSTTSTASPLACRTSPT